MKNFSEIFSVFPPLMHIYTSRSAFWGASLPWQGGDSAERKRPPVGRPIKEMYTIYCMEKLHYYNRILHQLDQTSDLLLQPHYWL